MKRIIITNLNKEFKISYRENKSFLAKLLLFFFKYFGKTNEIRFKKSNKIQVANNISFEAEAGENVGIIGLNGSGKSTLLRLIAEIYKPDSGEIISKGSLVYLSGFGQGLQPLLTMRENIYLMGAIMGLSQSEIRLRFDEIVEFAGLKEFVNTKVYQFSSGMSARLNFSVTIFCLHHRNPDILLLDEVLGEAGDIDFQNKALLKMEEFINGGSTVILVSHDLEIIKKYCNKVIWLDRGEIVKIGNVNDIINDYITNHL
jgi:ABC-type polysaccharide/polyol phosphate transport system ATPase subunit